MTKRVDEKTLQFVRDHAGDDVRQLALMGNKHPEVGNHPKQAAFSFSSRRITFVLKNSYVQFE